MSVDSRTAAWFASAGSGLDAVERAQRSRTMPKGPSRRSSGAGARVSSRRRFASGGRRIRPVRVLVAVDGSRQSVETARYVGRLLRHMRDAQVTLLHVLRPLPPVLREHGGSEDPDREAQLGSRLRRERRAWYRHEEDLERNALLPARRALVRMGFGPAALRTKFAHDDDVVEGILAEARRGRYRTIVVGRRGETGLRGRLFGDVTSRLLRRATGCAVWVVE